MTKINHDNQKFEILLDNEKAGEILYNYKDENTINIYHTEVGSAYSGHGLGKKLVEAAVDFAKENKLKIAATCPYANAILSKDSNVKDIFEN